MNSIDYDDFNYINPLWRLADPLTVEQAAALIAGFDPNLIRYDTFGGVYFESETGSTDRNGSHGVQTAYSALKNAITSTKLKAKIIYDSRPISDEDAHTLFSLQETCDFGISNGFQILVEDDEHVSHGFFVKNHPNWEKSLIEVDDLRTWLVNKGYRTGFFFPDSTDTPDYLDPNHPRYAPKLAAVVKAWLAVGEDAGNNGKSVKQTLLKWLRENASKFKLSDDEGKPNETGIEECAKVANWQDKGGAPKTPNG